jgi:ferredoxin--NADP+ reductase
MSQVNQERVLSVHHWNDSLFSFKTTRSPSLRFRNGHFVMKAQRRAPRGLEAEE